MKTLLKVSLLCLVFTACQKETAKTVTIASNNTWKPVYVGSGNNAVNSFQAGSEYYISFEESLLNVIGGNDSRTALGKSFGYISLNGAPGMAYNTLAYISRDSLYVAKNTSLENTKAVGKLSDFGINNFSYVHQLADVYSEAVLINEYNEIIIPLFKPFENKVAYAYLSLAGDVADSLPVSVKSQGLVDFFPGINSADKSLKRVVTANNQFFFLTENSGLYKVQNDIIVKTLLGKNIMDVFVHGTRLGAVVQDTLNGSRMYFSQDNGASWTTVNQFTALDTLDICSRSFFSDGKEIFSYSDCGLDGLFSHTLSGSNVVTRKVKVDGVENFQGVGMVLESDRLFFNTKQGVFAASRDSLYEEAAAGN